MAVWQMLLNSLGLVLSWPVIVLVLGIMYRRPVGAAIGRLTKFRGFGQEAEFSPQLASVEESIQQTASPQEELEDSEQYPQDSDSLGQWDDLGSLAETEPSFLILSSWDSFNEGIRKLAAIAREAFPNLRSRDPLAPLYEDGVIARENEGQIRALRELRNLVAHGRHQPTPGEALTYWETTDQLWRTILSRARHPSRFQRFYDRETGNLKTPRAL